MPDNPAYAVRYAHARAVSGVRWAAALGATAQGEAGAARLMDAANDPDEQGPGIITERDLLRALTDAACP